VPDKGVPEIFPVEEISAQVHYAEMAAASYSSDVLQLFYGPIPMSENRNLPEPLSPDVTVRYDGFKISQNNFKEWLRVWRMVYPEQIQTIKTFLGLQKNKEKFTNLVEQEILKLKNVKVSFALEVKFSIERNGETQHMKHYFENDRQTAHFQQV